MATRTVYDCDRCGKKEIEPAKFRVAIGLYWDGAEHTQNFNHYSVCSSCAGKIIELLFDKYTISKEEVKEGLKLAGLK